jgi:hypothetical protein
MCFCSSLKEIGCDFVGTINGIAARSGSLGGNVEFAGTDAGASVGWVGPSGVPRLGNRFIVANAGEIQAWGMPLAGRLGGIFGCVFVEEN